MTDFRVVDSTTRCQASFLSLDELTVAGPEGDTFQRTVVRHPGAVVMAPVEDGRVLMVRQWRAAVGGALLELPAGKRDVAGEAPETTAARELEEEIGRRPGRLTLLAEFYNSPGFCDEHSHLFCATSLERLPRRAVSAEEHAMTIEPVALDAVPGLIARRELVDAKSIIGLLLTREHLEGRGGR